MPGRNVPDDAGADQRTWPGRVDRIDDVGRRLIAEGVRRLQADGVRVEVEDPERILPLEEAGAH